MTPFSKKSRRSVALMTLTQAAFGLAGRPYPEEPPGIQAAGIQAAC